MDMFRTTHQSAATVKSFGWARNSTRKWRVVSLSCILILVVFYICQYTDTIFNQRIYVENSETLRSLVVDKLLRNGDMDSRFNDMVTFLSRMGSNNSCSNLQLIPELDRQPDETYVRGKMNFLKEKLKSFSNLEGYSDEVRSQVAFYALLVRQPWVRQVCEIGFNAGHSALYWLAASNVTRLLSFDLGEHDYTRTMANFISATFPGRFNIVYGDSTKTVPQYVANMADTPLACDVIVVDGGHDYAIAKADLQSMRAFARSPRHLLIVDDTPCDVHYCVGPNKVWSESQGTVKSLFGCTVYPQKHRGFVVGYYLV